MKLIYAYDPIIRKRVVYVVRKGIATSLATGHKFDYEKEKTRKIELNNRENKIEVIR